VPLKKLSEEGYILVANGVADLLHIAMVALQEALCCGNSQLLQVGERTVAGGLLEAANEIPEAHANSPGGSTQGKVLLKILVEPLLSAGNGFIGMLGLERHYAESSLPRSRRFNK